jgi:hypothetical protein
MDKPQVGRLAPLALLLVLGQTAALSAAPATESGPMALALAALVAQNSPLVSAADKKTIASLFGGSRNVSYPAGKKISVTADSVICRVSNVDLTQRSCDLAFGSAKRSVKGGAASAIYATIAAVGVPQDGAAGTIYESVSMLACTLDPNEIKQATGGGASCTFMPGS